MLIQIPTEHRTVFSKMSVSQFAKSLLDPARQMDLNRYLKTRRSPRNPPPKEKTSRSEGLYSTAKLLANRKSKSAPWKPCPFRMLGILNRLSVVCVSLRPLAILCHPVGVNRYGSISLPMSVD